MRGCAHAAHAALTSNLKRVHLLSPPRRCGGFVMLTPTLPASFLVSCAQAAPAPPLRRIQRSGGRGVSARGRAGGAGRASLQEAASTVSSASASTPAPAEAGGRGRNANDANDTSPAPAGRRVLVSASSWWNLDAQVLSAGRPRAFPGPVGGAAAAGSGSCWFLLRLASLATFWRTRDRRQDNGGTAACRLLLFIHASQRLLVFGEDKHGGT